MKYINTTGTCVADKHYMVDISDKINQVKKMVDKEQYFTINRARQYGKTTTLSFLQKYIQEEYTVIRISFEGVGETMFENAHEFCQRFLWLVDTYFKNINAIGESWQNNKITDFDLLGEHINEMCKNQKIVLMIDEVDKTSNNRVFIQFLGLLRHNFLLREESIGSTFHSVILAGVYDIKNIKLKMINEISFSNTQIEGKLYNSPWNIAVDFDVDMSFNPYEISTMLNEYENDYNTGMNIDLISQVIHDHTNGYPFLVSRICQHIDQRLNRDWTPCGVRNAVKIILKEKNTLFDDLFKNIENNSELYDLIYGILIIGKQYTFEIEDPIISLAAMFGIIIDVDGKTVISNRIFEIRICNYFISKDEKQDSKKVVGVTQNLIVKDGVFDMELCLRKFSEHYSELFTENDMEFLERHGRLLFLSYLRPLINGQGFYHIESSLTDLRRMDIVVDYGQQQYIIELKIWRGNVQHNNAYEQLLGYMDSKKSQVGYLLTFDLRKDVNRQPKAEWIEVLGKQIFDVVV